jgi:cation-transporting ATPase E
MNGLTSEEVRQQFYEGNVNVQPDSSAKTVGGIVKENVFTYFNGIFLLLAILLIAAGSFRSLTFLPVVIVNTLIGIIQEVHAKNVLDKLAVLNQSTAVVLREGREEKIPVSRLVLGDVIRLRSGSQIPADAEVIEGSITVNESLLTGEEDEIEKTPAGQKALKSGSFVIAGDCFARLTQVGRNSYISKLTAKAKEMPGQEQSEMVRDINRLILLAGILIIPIGIILFVQSFAVQGNSFSDSVVSMVAAVIGMIPEGLYLLVSVALALSAVRLAQNQVVLHDMKSIETLARADVFCVDKTGTITDNEMTVSDCVAPEDTDPAAMTQTRMLISRYLKTVTDDNITMQALRGWFPEEGGFTAIHILPFSSKNKYSEVEMRDRRYRLGAPECVLDAGQLKRNSELIDRYAMRGERVLVFAECTAAEPEGFQALAFIVLQNGIRQNVMKTFAYFRRQGVHVKVISGDNPVTVSRIAKSVGIAGAEKYIDASELKTKEDIYEAAARYTVFGRVQPEQKKLIVRSLKQQGRTVAMTGDGVNDILAMKEADCSIAMGTGSEAARQAAQVVLLDSDFSRMRSIVFEGRRDINNISRSATLFLVKNIFSLLLAVFSIINVLQYPLQPTQISLISMFNIGIPAFFLALEPNDRRQKPHFLRRVLIRALPASLTDFFAIAALVVFGQVFGVSSNDVSVASTFLLAIVGFMILVNISAPMNKYHFAVIAGCIIGIMVTAYLFSDLFAITYVSKECIMLFLIFAIAVEPIMRYLTKLFRLLERKLLPD